MNRGHRTTQVTIIAMFAFFLTNAMPSTTNATTRYRIPNILEPTRIVVVVPKYGYAVGPIRTRLSHSEIDVVRRLQSDAISPNIPATNPILTAQFRIEPIAQQSPTIALGIKALRQAAELLYDESSVHAQRPFIIIGRSQQFLNDTIRSIGCTPDLAAIGGAFLMGATICNRQVIVINLTGYLFLKSRGLQLTDEMESLPEPSIAATNYLIADRNIAGLAHEWTHVARSYISHGIIADNEPAWFREGLAEVVSGMARVRASTNQMTYQDFHVIRLRKFANWPSECHDPLRSYRANSSIVGGCEYLRGAVALELLIANYGGISNVVRLYKSQRTTGDFFKSFSRIYGMSMSQFELRADKYATYITQAATYIHR